MSANPSRWGVDFEQYLRFDARTTRASDRWTETWTRQLVTEGVRRRRHGAALDVERFYDALPNG